MQYGGYELDGYMTDIQVFSKVLTAEEMKGYTSCEKVLNYFAYI